MERARKEGEQIGMTGVGERGGVSRRGFLRAVGGGGAAALVGVALPGWSAGRNVSGAREPAAPRATAAARAGRYPFSLPALPYSPEALEPFIDAETMRIHHSRHHNAYVNGLNAALEPYPDLHGHSLESLLGSLQSLPEGIRTAVRNHGGGHANHTLFWEVMAPDAGGEPGGDLSEAIRRTFGAFLGLQQEFNRAATGRFGSGWGWLSVDGSGKLRVESSANQDTPLMEGRTPILGVDVWEHAYYLKYQWRRADYLAAWWRTVNWAEVARRYRAALSARSG